MKVLKSRRFWLRNALNTNDASEIIHGKNCLITSYNDEKGIGGRFHSAVNSIVPNLTNRIDKQFNDGDYHRITETYITCISEHDIGDDAAGKLSMWRAYGGRGGVAFVFKSEPFLSSSTATINAFGVPVLYGGLPIFQGLFDRISENIEKNRKFLKSIDPEEFLTGILRTLHFLVISTKHPSFIEEREWRIVYSPYFIPSDIIEMDVESINGVVQKIHKIPLEDYADKGFTGATIPDLIDHIIIGPCAYPQSTYAAFCQLLVDAGVSDPEKRVVHAGIPLRQ